ncbi:MAG: polar amino acid transport system substrate-binding protein [Paraburkholderia sp.]|jgi:polar amino acid transport system substrate-binding protein|uniref:transporter substrate-binding domain-containing protein n=1 Tax=Paraburkholderia sp. TaxID=1926495 RepID=UPI002AFE9762|nr:transporter substrate-binding domain-containing protein [Paraburkholderia sp.]MEA3088632.1 polar amino acid transport system substrate-binding protein [Paraburkholderia sp.]
MRLDPSIIAAFAPSGTLRVAINLGNPILARIGDDPARPSGISVDIATELARRLSVPIGLVVMDAAAKSVEAVENGHADVGFFAVDPVRAAEIAFTEPYLLIEGCYLVDRASTVTTNEQVDSPHNRVAVGAGSAYDLFLTRELKHAQIVRARTSPAVVETFLTQRLEVAAGVRQQLEADARRYDDLRVLVEPFMVIRQAAGIARVRGPAASRHLDLFIDELKTSGRIDALIARHGIAGVSVAPAKAHGGSTC